MNKLLILVDCQNDFLEGSLAIQDFALTSSAVFAICDKIKKWDGDIIITQDTHYEATYKDTLEGKNIPVKHCIKNSWGWSINPYIYQALTLSDKEYQVVQKQSFGSISLSNHIINNKYKGIEICGFCTDICVISNALILRAYFPNLPIIIDAACCAGTNPKMHEAALLVMEKNCIKVINKDEDK